jgi:uncharacterized protein YjbI with pentapeptide repeats
MTRSVLWFSRFTGADVRGAIFVEADLSNADFAGADVTGADFSGTDLDGANFAGARGMASVKGWDKALNTERIRR